MFGGIVYYYLEIADKNTTTILILFGSLFVIISGLFMAKLAIDPLLEYTLNLKNLSKETLHELNLPISTIRSNVQMLLKTLDDSKAQRRIQRIEQAALMLQERYNELEYMIKRETQTNIKEWCRVDKLVQERVAFLETLYPGFSFELHLEMLQVYTDVRGLSKVIDNLIDNGVKYSDKSKKIIITIKDKSLYIKDFGIGMDEIELIHIFDNYYQSNTQVQGFGIGLAMVKRFCDTHHIVLRFDSQKGVATEVSLQFQKTGKI